MDISRVIRDVERAITFIFSWFWVLFSGINSNNRDPVKGTNNNEISIINLINKNPI